MVGHPILDLSYFLVYRQICGQGVWHLFSQRVTAEGAIV